MIRNAFPSDRMALGHIYCETWKAAYRGMIPDGFLDALTDETCAPPAVREDRTLVWEENGQVVGLVHIGPGRDGAFADAGEIQSIYVLPSYWRSGIGKKLLTAAEERLLALGFSRMYLWALTDNTRARAFYESMGMQMCGERTISIGGAELSETQYAKALAGQ